jgi:hypothetical protein
MSTLFAPRAGTVHQTAHALHWLSRMRSPLEAWSGRSRLLVGLLIGAVVFAVGANGWISADLAGVQASRVALSDAEHRVAQAQQALAQLPALRRQAAATATANGQAPATWTPADDMRLMSLLALRSGVTLLTLAPGVGRNAGSDTVRSLHLTVQADFLHLMIFLRGLSDMPVLVVLKTST